MHLVFYSTTLQRRALSEFFILKMGGGGGGGGLIRCFIRLFYDHYSFSFVSNCNAAVQLSGITNSLRAQRQGALLLWPQRPCEVTISLVNQSLHHPAKGFRNKRKKERKRKEKEKKRGGGKYSKVKGDPNRRNLEGTIDWNGIKL